MNYAPIIGVFDSGVGGLSVVKAIRGRLPAASICYCCDNLNFPYGPKSEAEVVLHATAAVTRLTHRVRLDALVVACNTASTVTLPAIRERVTIPVIGVVPAIKPAAEQSRSKIIGLLATPGTIQRSYTDDLVREFAPHCQVVRVGSSRLVDLAEAKLRGAELDIPEVSQQIEGLFAINHGLNRLDTVVLGCTHFPLLLPELKLASAWPVSWVDSGDAIARRVASFFPELPPPSDQGSEVALFTKLDDGIDRLREICLPEFGFQEVSLL